VTDQLAESASDPFDPTETSEAAFLSQHMIHIESFPEERFACICNFGEEPPATIEEVTAHLFNASRSTMYRESAAILQAERATAGEDYGDGLHYGFGLMLARADAAEVASAVVSVDIVL